MRSYHIHGRLSEFLVQFAGHLRRLRQSDPDAAATELLRRRDIALSRIRQTYGVTWQDKRLLDVGSGQQCLWSSLFGEHNDVTAIDCEVIPHGFCPSVYFKMLRRNGVRRTLKTVVRKAVGVDYRMWRALNGAVATRLCWPQTYRMDGQDLAFPDASFDGVLSFSVFEHLNDPRRGMKEINRVLVPGGVAYVSLELFTSIAGSHDPRTWRSPLALPLWAHLRSSCATRWHTNVLLNKLRMHEFEDIARNHFDQVRFYREERGTRTYLDLLTPAERQQLSHYTDEELCTQDFVILARKAG